MGPGGPRGPHRSRAGRDDPVRGGGDEGVVALGAGDVKRRLGLLDGGLGGDDVLGGERVLAQGRWASAPRTWAWAAAWLFAARPGPPTRCAVSAWRRSGPPPRRPGPGRLGLGWRPSAWAWAARARFLGLLHVVGAGADRLGLLGLGLLDPLLRLLQVEGDLLPAGLQLQLRLLHVELGAPHGPGRGSWSRSSWARAASTCSCAWRTSQGWGRP